MWLSKGGKAPPWPPEGCSVWVWGLPGGTIVVSAFGEGVVRGFFCSAMALSDARGVRLYRYPEPEKWVGLNEPPDLWQHLGALGEEGVTVTRSPFWQIHPLFCRNVTVRKVKMSSLGTNNDGCNP